MLKPRQHISRNLLLLSPPPILSPSISNHRRTTHQVTIDSCHLLRRNPYSQSYRPISQSILRATITKQTTIPCESTYAPHHTTYRQNKQHSHISYMNKPSPILLHQNICTYIHTLHTYAHAHVCICRRKTSMYIIHIKSLNNQQTTLSILSLIYEQAGI